MSNWRAYGQWRHPKIWWECTLRNYFKVINPDKVPNIVNVVSVSKHKVVYVMCNNIYQFEITKKKIIETILPELN
jgi:hypothetical protein